MNQTRVVIALDEDDAEFIARILELMEFVRIPSGQIFDDGSRSRCKRLRAAVSNAIAEQTR